jgi:hypothetical protein
MIAEVYNMFQSRNRLDKLVWVEQKNNFFVNILISNEQKKGSFSETTQKKLEFFHSEVPRYCSLLETVRLYIWFLFGLLPFCATTSSVLCSVLVRDELVDAVKKHKFDFPGDCYMYYYYNYLIKF